MAEESLIVSRLREHLGPALRESIRLHEEETVVVDAARITDAMRFLRDDPQVDLHFLADVSGLDRLLLKAPPEERFAVVYHLGSFNHPRRLRVRAHLPEREPKIASVSSLWAGAAWMEREAYDLYGIEFQDHPDLRRMFMPEDYDGWPLRKDYPLRGRGERMELQRIQGPPPELARGHGYPGLPPTAEFNPAQPRRPVPAAADLIDVDEDRLEEFRRGRVTFADVEELPTKTLLMNFGPQHPATHGTLRIVMELDGERVVTAVPELGFLHTGFEKLGEYRHWNDFITLTDRTNYLSPMANNFGYAMAVERLLGVTIPARAQYLRVIFAEMARISDHLLCIGTMALDLGAFTAFLYGFKIRELLYDIFEAVTGARFTVSYARVGGLACDVPADFGAMCQNFLEKCPQAVADMAELLDRNRIFQDRTRGVGVITKADALSWCVTGPCIRASGIPHDLREAAPYSSYGDFEFDIPVGENGDVYDRYLVRMEEMRQSLRIIEQALRKLPGGPIMTEDERVALPSKDKVYGSIEGLIYHFKQIMDRHGFTPPQGEAYAGAEAPNGELGYYVVSDGGICPYRVRIRPPSLLHYQIFPHLMKGRLLSDAVAILGSLNVIAGELDR